jgi:hypothetical protein
MADVLRSRLVDDTQPVDVDAMAKLLGCRVVQKQLSAGRTMEAELRPDADRDGFQLAVDPTPRGGWDETPAAARLRITRHRRRFRIAHELGHTLFFTRRRGCGPRRARPWAATEEDWCDEFARQLLVPSSAARLASPNARIVVELHQRYDVSIEVAARAVAAANRGVCTAVWFWPEDSAPSARTLLRQWCSVDTRSLRSWRDSEFVRAAMETGVTTGFLPSLHRPSKKLAASVLLDQHRRQLIVVASPAA